MSWIPSARSARTLCVLLANDRPGADERRLPAVLRPDQLLEPSPSVFARGGCSLRRRGVSLPLLTRRKHQPLFVAVVGHASPHPKAGATASMGTRPCRAPRR